MISFHENNHLLTPRYDQLYAELVPSSGPCETLEGELLRAVSRIAHDYTNNGFGNNWSGALNFLDEHLGVSKGIRRLLEIYARGKIRHDATFNENDAVYVAIDLLFERVVTSIGDQRHPSPCNMFDLQERDHG